MKEGKPMEIFTVSLFGHRKLDNAYLTEQKLERVVRELIKTKDYVEFLVGRSGAFDLLAAAAVQRVRKALGTQNTELTLVLPYMTADYRDNEELLDAYYDNTLICPISEKVHFKAAMQTRNRWMVDQSSLVVCCVQHPHGGAYQTIRYAAATGKDIINLAENGKETTGEGVEK